MRRISDRDGARGVPLRVDLHGRTSAQPPLVLVHGFMGSVDSWSALAAHLAHGREVIVPQLPGHGEGAVLADPAECAVERVAERLARLVERLGAAEADWLGYSMGGRIVLAGVAAGVIRPRRLILESASPGLAGAEERAGRRALSPAAARCRPAGRGGGAG